MLSTHGVVCCGVLARPFATHAWCGVRARRVLRTHAVACCVVRARRGVQARRVLRAHAVVCVRSCFGVRARAAGV